MISDEHWEKIKCALQILAERNKVTDDRSLYDFFRTHDDVLYNESALDVLLQEKNAEDLAKLKEQLAEMQKTVDENEK